MTFFDFCIRFKFQTHLFIFCRSILEFNPLSGSFVVNPPLHCTELIDATLNHIDGLLTLNTDPLSFIVILAESETEFVKKLDSSPFKRRQVVIPAMEHYYRHGFQYSIPK